MAEAAFAIPGDIRSATGGYSYDRRLIELLPRFGVAVTPIGLPGAFPNPTEADLKATAAALSWSSGRRERGGG